MAGICENCEDREARSAQDIYCEPCEIILQQRRRIERLERALTEELELNEAMLIEEPKQDRYWKNRIERCRAALRGEPQAEGRANLYRDSVQPDEWPGPDPSAGTGVEEAARFWLNRHDDDEVSGGQA